jgi:hypothetical protein
MEMLAYPVLNRCDRIEKINNPIPRSNSLTKVGHRQVKPRLLFCAKNQRHINPLLIIGKNLPICQRCTLQSVRHIDHTPGHLIFRIDIWISKEIRP